MSLKDETVLDETVKTLAVKSWNLLLAVFELWQKTERTKKPSKSLLQKIKTLTQEIKELTEELP